MSAAFLELGEVTAGYGPITVLDGLSLRLGPAEFLAVLGANGSGKSTVLKTVIGLTRMTAGRILLTGTDIARRPAHERAALGIGRPEALYHYSEQVQPWIRPLIEKSFVQLLGDVITLLLVGGITLLMSW